MEIVAIISIVSVLAWFLIGFRKGVNLDHYSESQLRDELEKEEHNRVKKEKRN